MRSIAKEGRDLELDQSIRKGNEHHAEIIFG